MGRIRDLIKLCLAGGLLIAAALIWREQPPLPRHSPRQPSPRERLPQRYGGQWRPAQPEERKAAITVIEAQLEAFRKDDYQSAARYQSVSLQHNFPSVTEFRRMMRLTYPQFTNFRTVRYGPARWDFLGDRLTIPVTVTGNDDVTVSATYTLIREGGEFRVLGVSGGFAPDSDEIRSI